MSPVRSRQSERAGIDIDTDDASRPTRLWLRARRVDAHTGTTGLRRDPSPRFPTPRSSRFLRVCAKTKLASRAVSMQAVGLPQRLRRAKWHPAIQHSVSIRDRRRHTHPTSPPHSRRQQQLAFRFRAALRRVGAIRSTATAPDAVRRTFSVVPCLYIRGDPCPVETSQY